MSYLMWNKLTLGPLSLRISYYFSGYDSLLFSYILGNGWSGLLSHKILHFFHCSLLWEWQLTIEKIVSIRLFYFILLFYGRGVLYWISFFTEKKKMFFFCFEAFRSVVLNFYSFLFRHGLNFENFIFRLHYVIWRKIFLHLFTNVHLDANGGLWVTSFRFSLCFLSDRVRSFGRCIHKNIFYI